MITDAALERFCQIVSVQTGLVVPTHDKPYLREKLTRRLHATRTEVVEHYLTQLLSDGVASETEWRELVLELTTGESYFFRDAGQMRLLREVIFPELFRTRESERSLRVWSAGCSTGEEPYSLAIMLQTLLTPLGPWDVWIKGTDINEYALQRAREGRYGRWAFRGVTDDIVERYFYRVHGEWQLSPTLRGMVNYERLNLIRESFPDPTRGLHDMDLIVCRNVFIYFNHDAIAGIMARFAACLRPGGYIMTGHAEVQHPVSQLVTSGVLPLVTRQFPDSTIFYRPIEGDPKPTTKQERVDALIFPTPIKAKPVVLPKKGGVEPRPVVAPSPPVTGRVAGPQSHPAPAGRASTHPADKSIKKARQLFAQGRYGEAIQLAESLLGVVHLVADVALLLAQGYANLGDGVKAEAHCRDVLRHRPFAAEPHFLLATLVYDRGDVEQAKLLLHKTLYVDRAHVPAYLQLATIYQEEGIPDRARQMRLGALDVLHGLPATHRVEHYEEWTVQELVMQLEKMLGESGGR